MSVELGLRSRVRSLLEAERRRYAELHPSSQALAQRAGASLLGGVPMPFMTEWPGSFPLFASEAVGAKVVDVDGNRYDDFCLGDSGAMTGHAIAPITEALVEHSRSGATHMLPTEDSIEVGAILARRFGVPIWQFALSATDANRFALRIARKVTGRRMIVVFNWCYHGTVDEASVCIVDGAVRTREPDAGAPVDPSTTTRVVEFNDLAALERALADGEVACVLAEPALTNIGIVLPEPDFHRGLRELTRRYGTLLIIDETHTLCMGPGGCTHAWRLDPDLVVVGKPIAGGVPAAAYGLSTAVAEALQSGRDGYVSVTGGIGGTLAGNALAARLMRVTLSRVLTPEAFESMIARADRYVLGVRAAIEQRSAPWHVAQLGARAEYRFTPQPPRTGSEAMAADDHELSAFMHLHALNRGVLLTPFHNMVLMSPATANDQVDHAVDVFSAAIGELFA
jgi:glutamate-1-semialdehyde 2,1-aminomutase